MKPNLQSMEPKIAEQAARWLIELEDAGPRARKEFAGWLKQSPQHVQEFLLATAAWKEFDDFDREETRPAPVSFFSATESRIHFQNLKKPRLLALAATVSLIACGLGLWQASRNAHTLTTAIGEQRVYTLTDGSRVELNTDSRARVNFSGRGRDIQLLEGEALFTVHRDPTRPFRVHAGNAVVQALGTQFNVYRHEEDTTVSVIEGVVQVSEGGRAMRLAAGEQAEAATGTVRKRIAPDLPKALAWQAQRLLFRGDSLETVASEFNRYNRLQIELKGNEVRGKRLTGVFDADDPQSLLQFLGRDEALSIERTGSAVIIRAR